MFLLVKSLFTRFDMKIYPRLLKSKLRVSMFNVFANGSIKLEQVASFKPNFDNPKALSLSFFFISSPKSYTDYESFPIPVSLISRSSIVFFSIKTFKIYYIVVALICSLTEISSFLR